MDRWDLNPSTLVFLVGYFSFFFAPSVYSKTHKLYIAVTTFTLLCVSFTINLLGFCAASTAHQYAAASSRAWGYERWAWSPHVLLLPPHAPARTPGPYAYGSAQAQRTTISLHDSAPETGRFTLYFHSLGKREIVIVIFSTRDIIEVRKEGLGTLPQFDFSHFNSKGTPDLHLTLVNILIL